MRQEPGRPHEVGEEHEEPGRGDGRVRPRRMLGDRRRLDEKQGDQAEEDEQHEREAGLVAQPLGKVEPPRPRVDELEHAAEPDAEDRGR